MHRNRKKRNIVIFSLVGVLFLMVVGYAAFSTNLEIKGTSKVTSNWDIEITNVTEGIASGSAENTVKPSWDKLWASMEADLYDVGDSMEYDVTIENKGNIDAKLNDILTNVEKENNEAVIITFSGYTKGEILKANSSKLVHVKIEYNPEYEGGETSSEVEINFDYVQNNNETNNPDNQYLVTYDYHTNGGTNADIKEEFYGIGSNINPENTAYKEGWTFVGWNTDKDANIGLTNIEIKENTTLYAIYSKAIKVTYEKGENIESIGKVEDTCNIYNNNTTCEITLPEITSTIGYNPDGWYIGNNKAGNTNESYKITNGTILTAKAIDNIKPSISITNSSNGNWTNKNIKVTVTSTDEGSGIDHYEWNNNGVWTSSGIVIENGVGIITFTDDDNTDIEFRAIDKAGNISDISTTPIKIDTVAPTCSLSINGTVGNSSWYRTNVTISLTKKDNSSGVASYGISTKSTADYNSKASATQTADTKSVTYYGYVKDAAGNTCKKSKTFKKDATKPSTPYCIKINKGYLTQVSSSCNGKRNCSSVFKYGGSGNWWWSAEVVEDDNLSGLKEVQQYLKSTNPYSSSCNWVPKSSCNATATKQVYPSTADNRYRSVDNAGNVSATAECDIEVRK